VFQGEDLLLVGRIRYLKLISHVASPSTGFGRDRCLASGAKKS
jgi:hypothetical protein